MGTGFEHLEFIDLALAGALEAAEDVTVALDLFQRQKANGFRFVDIVDAANEAQHKLLVTTPGLSDDASPIYYLRETCRWAALIYNDMVVFPLPTTTETKPRLSNGLRFAIEHYEILSAKPTSIAGGVVKAIDHSEVILWALMLGAMAAAWTVNSPWYKEKLGHYLSQSPYRHTWLDFRRLMSTYLWWAYILDEPGQRLWWEGHLASESHGSTDVAVYQPDYAFRRADNSR